MTALILTGTVVTYDDDQPVVKGGAVYIGEGGVIDAVQPVRRAVPAGFTKARRVATERGIDWSKLTGPSPKWSRGRISRRGNARR